LVVVARWGAARLEDEVYHKDTLAEQVVSECEVEDETSLCSFSGLGIKTK